MYNNTCHSQVRVTAKRNTRRTDGRVSGSHVVERVSAIYVDDDKQQPIITAHYSTGTHGGGSGLTLFQHPGTGKPSSPWERGNTRSKRQKWDFPEDRRNHRSMQARSNMVANTAAWRRNDHWRDECVFLLPEKCILEQHIYRKHCRMWNISYVWKEITLLMMVFPELYLYSSSIT